MSYTAPLRANTSTDLIIGPFVDSTDGDSEETALGLVQADVMLSKNAGAAAQKAETTSPTHRADGFYWCILNNTDTDTVGRLTLWVHKAGALAVRHDYMVLPEPVYDALYASGGSSGQGIFPAMVDAIFAELIGGAAFSAHVQFQTDTLASQQTPANPIIRGGTVAAAAAGTVTLDAGASAVDDAYTGLLILITAGTGEGQSRYITDYVGSTKVATIDGNWTVQPDSASRFVILR